MRDLFKDEVRNLGPALGLPRDVIFRHTFPDPGLGVRILGEVRKEFADLLRRADAIFIEALPASGWYDWTSQTFAVFVPVVPEGCRLATPDQQQLTAGAVVVRGTLQCRGGLAGKTLRISGLERTITDVLVRIEHADGRVESYLLRPATPSVTLGAATSGLERAASYLQLGVQHILLGADHLLFVLGLLLIVRDRWMLVKTITAFTVAHSIAQAIATLGYASAPLVPLNAAIALSILFLGPEIVRVWRGESSFSQSVIPGLSRSCSGCCTDSDSPAD